MKSRARKQFIIMLILIFILLALMLAVMFSSFYKRSARDIRDLGMSNMKSQAVMVENYLNKGGNVLWFAAGSVDFMIQKGVNSEDIRQYLLDRTAQMQEEFDANFTGIYGLVNGVYLDGAGWEPPADYDPASRSWYIEAVEAKGEMVLSEPYVDAQTGEIVVSFSQLLSDGQSVLALDIILNEVQAIAEEMTMGGRGYGFIIDDAGLVVAHYDSSEIGKDYSKIPEWKEVIKEINDAKQDEFETIINGQKATVFSDLISKNWHVVIVAENAQMYREIRLQTIVGVIIALIIYLIIVIFTVASARRIAKAEQGEQESLERLQHMNMNIIRSLASTIDAKDRYTSGHSKRVADYALMLAKKLGKSEEEQQIIYYAGLLHDVGKIRVPESVIDKPGKLTDEEFDQIRIHPVSGFHILHDIHEDERIEYGAKYHHERFDGRGYPNGLEGMDIPEVSRIIAVADAYDAMASDRSYRKALPQEVVRSEIEKGRGTQFDPEVAEKMLEIIDEDKDYELRQKENRHYNILILDDEQMIIVFIRHLLKDVGNVSVIGANKPKEAFSALEENAVDLILLDLVLPETDGFEIYAQIREKYDIPVIMMTGDKSRKTLNKIRELKIDDYLTKPLNKAITKETIYGVLHRDATNI